MTKTLGCNNYFQGNGLYYLKAIIPYIQKIEPTLLVPQSWSTGGGLNDKAKKFGILPDWENNKEGRGHQAKYKGTTMYKFSKLLINELKTLAPRKPRLTPIEKANKEAQKQEANIEAITLKTVSKDYMEKLKELLANAGPTKLEPFEDTAPKGFVILRDVEGIPFMIPIKSIIYVSPYCEDRELTKIEYMTEDNRRYCPVSCDSFAVVVDLIRKASEV